MSGRVLIDEAGEPSFVPPFVQQGPVTLHSEAGVPITLSTEDGFSKIETAGCLFKLNEVETRKMCAYLLYQFLRKQLLEPGRSTISTILGPLCK